MKRAALLICTLLVACPRSDSPTTAVDFVNASTPTRCAEEDNVYVRLSGERIGSFRLRAVHPPYIGSVREDSTAPDFTHCNMTSDPRFPAIPRSVVLHEDGTIRLVGHTFDSFWRPAAVEFRVGERSESGLHLVQLVRIRAGGDIEQLVVYPPDGYWRVKPLPPRSLHDTAYGSSFLFGPVEEAGRPFVALRSIAFEPKRLRFSLEFANGSRGSITVAESNEQASVLELALDPPSTSNLPFAALRSMYVDEQQADVSVAQWSAASNDRIVAPILDMPPVRAVMARFGRDVPSRHNLSAPDFVFEAFRRAAPR